MLKAEYHVIILKDILSRDLTYVRTHQCWHKHHSLRGPARARPAAYLLLVTPSLDFFGGYWRGGCTLSCCVVPIEDETDSEWDPDATDVDTDVGTDNDPASPSAAAA